MGSILQEYRFVLDIDTVNMVRIKSKDVISISIIPGDVGRDFDKKITDVLNEGWGFF